MSSKRKPPPFAKALLLKRRSGVVPTDDITIYCGWRWAKHWTRTYKPWSVVVPDDADLSALDFSVCAALSCMLIGDKQERMDDVARELLKLDLERLVGAATDTKRITVYLPAS